MEAVVLIPSDGLFLVPYLVKLLFHSARPSMHRAPLVGLVLAAFIMSGCASLRRQKIVPESMAACRQLSREGVAAMELGHWDQAHTLLTEAVATSPADLDAHRHLAEVLWQKGDHRPAVVHMEAAVRLDPRHAPTLVRAGEMLLEVGAVDRAMERAEQAISLDTTLAGAWALRGNIYRQQGNVEAALADLQQSLRYSPHSADVLLAVAEIQYATGRPQRCLTTLHHLLDIYPPGEEPQRVLWLEGLAYQKVGRQQDAVESLAAASLRGAPQADLLYQLAIAEQAMGSVSAAANAVRQALAVDGEHQQSQLLLAQLKETSGIRTDRVIRR